MILSGNLPILIVAYRRYDNIKLILEKCSTNGITNIYVSIDGPKDELGRVDHDKIHQVIKDFSVNHRISIKVLGHRKNMGCAVNLIHACNWFFSENDYGAILEDDCLPSNEFFSFIRDIYTIFSSAKNVLVVCGTQFAPNLSNDNSAFLSKYPLTWGWATTSQKWKEIFNYFLTSHVYFKLQSFKSAEFCFWNAAERRATEGYTDVWDSVLVSFFSKYGKLALLPRNNLVVNVGNDAYATHTKFASDFLNMESGIYRNNGLDFIHDPKVDSWLKNNFYKISNRHIITTKITFILDKLFRRKMFDYKLKERLQFQIEANSYKY